MTTPAEKIRQVVKETQEYFNCITAQKEAALYAQLKLLDAIIDWKQQQLRTLRVEAKENTTLYCSVLLDKLHLEEARTSLTTTLL